MRCSLKSCKYKAYPIDVKDAKELTKCPQCDPKGHKKVRQAANQARMTTNSPKSQLDVGKVLKLDDAEVGNVPGLTDSPGVEVDYTPTPSEAGSKLEIPVASSADIKGK